MSRVSHEMLSRDIGSLQAELRVMRSELITIRQRQDTMLAQANRWRGGFLVLVGLGAIIGWVSDLVFKYFMRL